nr:hypothetical protein [Tanacetum cinerariifolium]
LRPRPELHLRGGKPAVLRPAVWRQALAEPHGAAKRAGRPQRRLVGERARPALRQPEVVQPQLDLQGGGQWLRQLLLGPAVGLVDGARQLRLYGPLPADLDRARRRRVGA